MTRVLQALDGGDPSAAEELLPLVYQELRRLARARMAREKPNQTLQPTALVHEAYLRLIGGASVSWNSRGHFFAAAAEAMRRILVERARSKARLKRGAGRQPLALTEEPASAEPGPGEILALDDALRRLEERDARMAEVVKLRCFVGLALPETAEALGTSERSVSRLWTAARAWLARELEGGAE